MGLNDKTAGTRRADENILAGFGIKVILCAESHLCCGCAGIWIGLIDRCVADRPDQVAAHSIEQPMVNLAWQTRCDKY